MSKEKDTTVTGYCISAGIWLTIWFSVCSAIAKEDVPFWLYAIGFVIASVSAAVVMLSLVKATILEIAERQRGREL